MTIDLHSMSMSVLAVNMDVIIYIYMSMNGLAVITVLDHKSYFKLRLCANKSLHGTQPVICIAYTGY
jgi:hypothetical protein